MKRKLTLILVCAMLLGILSACGGNSGGGSSNGGTNGASSGGISGGSVVAADDENPTVSVSFALMLADDHPHSIAATTVMAAEVAEATGGKFTIDVQTNGSLGSDAETTEATTMGMMYMTGPTAATLATLDPNWYILDVPYVFTTKEQIRNALDGELGEYLSNSLEESVGLICLGFGESGMRGLSNNVREITSPADLSGMKIRTLENKYHLATFAAIGANPTPMAFGEVYTALQTGQIDGQDNAISITYTNKFYEVQAYYTRLDHLFNGNTYVVNAQWFHSLPESYQNALRTAVQDAVIEQRRLIDEQEESQIAEMEKYGCTVTTLTDEQKQAFVDATQSVRDDFVKEFGADGQQMLELAAKYAD